MNIVHEFKSKTFTDYKEIVDMATVKEVICVIVKPLRHIFNLSSQSEVSLSL